MIKRFIGYYKPHRKLFYFDMFCALIVAVCDLFYPMITRNIIQDYVPNRQLRLMIVWVLVLLGLYILKALLNYIIQYYGHVMGVRMQADMRREVFDHLQKLPFSYFDQNKTGVVMSRIVNDLMDVTELAHHGPEDLFISLIMLIGSFAILCTINVPLTVIAFALLPVAVYIVAKLRRRMNAAFRETRIKTGEVNAELENSISGIRVAKAFTGEKNERRKFERRNREFVTARSEAFRVMGQFSASTGFFTDVLNVVVLIAAACFLFAGKITTGDFVAYLLYVSMFLNPIKRLISFVEQFQQGATGFKRFVEIMEEPIEQDSPGAKPLQSAQGQIDFRGVGFTYDDDTEVLSGLDLHIGAGQTVALVGPSGGGKTTLCHLLPRFYDPTEGTIEIDCQDIRSYTLHSLRQNIGIVQQDVFLFTGTIRDNIAYAKPDATDEEIYQAARRANIHDFIMGLDDGYDTYIGERGARLSGGQKQRISIARVFLKDPPILILDEATSALDNETERLIQEALNDLSHGRTTLVVAHRLSTIKNADSIVVLTPQGIAETGSHRQLVAAGGLYARLWQSQFIGLDS
ncbi:ABC transporter ATP-binding protein [Neobittarella massiliensis]|uniref:ABC transporter ATP-binding protein n=1 Tax=Neobittarella massiliensis (ex Bilen et al. 2018) TaxID=2041842 RepID=A0A8J6IQ01_9FIRM|nr:ABC transporter ATP-binding protein [Neobittarella massiliensis]MBC3516957.1 ABC transporter ATP-binding protein [Neobittarella massiliensis]